MSRTSPLRLVTAMLLAGAASGCSSDVTRFDGIFSSKTDTLTTNSIPHKANAVNGRLPMPRRDVANAGDADLTGDQAMNQPYPANNAYDSISTSTTDESAARASVRPARIERSELTSSTPSRVRREEKVALAQPFPAKRILAEDTNADPIRTGTVKSTWRVSDNSPRIMIKSGDTLSALSVRYHVPQSEILKANNLESGADLKYGRSIVIPVAGKVETRGKVTDDVAELPKKKIPVPGNKMPEQDKAILPSTASRDKAKNADNKLASNAKKDDADGTVYVVKQGDSLAKIAKMHKVSVDTIKTANNMATPSIKIGQRLSIPDTDTVTASIPKKAEVKETAEVNKPKTYTPPVADTKSVEEVQKTDAGEKAPDETGIGKFRWPVRGAVIAGYGQNVDGVRNAGIDISVPEGTPIKSAENGVVIYAGSGLKDLGNTVLVRHDDGTVTVYGNASSLNVKRGDKVTRGQVVANSGMTGGAKRPKVHFEVRQNAVAVNPMTFLQ